MTTQLQQSSPAEQRIAEYIPFASKEPIKLSVSIVQNMIAVPTKQGHVCTESQALKFIMLCRSRLLNPFEGDAYLIGYDTKDGPSFSLVTAHQAFLKRAEVHPEYDGMQSGVIIDRGGVIEDREGDFLSEGDVLQGAWATVHFKNRKYPMRKRLNLRTFRKSYGRWNDDPAGMIVKCAEADALRSSFPTMLGGLYLREEAPLMEPQHGEAIVGDAKPTLAEKLKARANGAKQEASRASDEQLARIDTLIREMGIKEEGVTFLLTESKVPAFKALTPEAATDLIRRLEAEKQEDAEMKA